MISDQTCFNGIKVCDSDEDEESGSSSDNPSPEKLENKD